jgi:hypothetical protein
MGNDVSKGFNAVGNTIKEGLGAWFDPNKRKMILGQVAKRLPTLHEDLQRVSAEQSPALGLVSQVASGLIKTVPVAQLAEKVLGNVASGNTGGLIANAIEAKLAKPGAYTGNGMDRLDLMKGVANEIVSSEKKKTDMESPSATPARTGSVPAPSMTGRGRPRPPPRIPTVGAIKTELKGRADRLRELLRE